MTVSSTEAQNRFGRVLRIVEGGGRVVVHKHDRPAAVVLSADAYEELRQRARGDIDRLEEEFDALVARMRTRRGKEAARETLESGPEGVSFTLPREGR